MKKVSLLVALVMLLILSIQCTEDDTVEASVNQIDNHHIESGEEGDQELDNERD